MPTLPLSPTLSSPTNHKYIDNRPFLYKANIFYSLEKSIDGTISFSTNRFTIAHTVDQQIFHKTVLLSQIESIYFSRWRGHHADNKNGETLFFPYQYTVKMKDGETLKALSPPRFLSKLYIKNNQGSTLLYGYFVDYYQKGLWKNCKRKEKSWPEENPPELVFRKIQFQ